MYKENIWDGDPRTEPDFDTSEIQDLADAEAEELGMEKYYNEKFGDNE